MAKFDMMQVKRKLDEEKAAKHVKETLGQKILMVAVTALGLTMFYSFILTYHFSTLVNLGILAFFILLVVLRAIQVFKRKI